MRGEQPTVQHVELNLHELVLPANILAPEESLSPDVESEEEQSDIYRVDTYCGTCGTGVRIFILATAPSVRTFNLLLLVELCIICTGCVRTRFHHGRSF